IATREYFHATDHTTIYTLSLHDALPISRLDLRCGQKGLPEYKPQITFPEPWPGGSWRLRDIVEYDVSAVHGLLHAVKSNLRLVRSEEHTSELQSRSDLVCRLLLEKKKYV